MILRAGPAAELAFSYKPVLLQAVFSEGIPVIPGLKDGPLPAPADPSRNPSRGGGEPAGPSGQTGAQSALNTT